MRVRKSFIFTKLAANFNSVEAGHHPIENQKLRQLAARVVVHHFSAVFTGSHLMAKLLENPLKECQIDFTVVGDQNSHGFSSVFSAPIFLVNLRERFSE